MLPKMYRNFRPIFYISPSVFSQIALQNKQKVTVNQKKQWNFYTNQKRAFSSNFKYSRPPTPPTPTPNSKPPHFIHALIILPIIYLLRKYNETKIQHNQ